MAMSNAPSPFRSPTAQRALNLFSFPLRVTEVVVPLPLVADPPKYTRSAVPPLRHDASFPRNIKSGYPSLSRSRGPMPGQIAFVVPAVPESINSTELPKFLAVVCLYIEKPPLSFLARRSVLPSPSTSPYTAMSLSVPLTPLFRNSQVRNGSANAPGTSTSASTATKSADDDHDLPKGPGRAPR